MLEDKITDLQYLNNKIIELKTINKSADIQLLEKTIGALYLVELLSKTDLNFVFKGGTSLILVLDDLKRFSVDIDIITEDDFDKVETILDNIIINSHVFTRFEDNYRDNAVSKRMKIKHYKLYYISATDNSEKFILFDVAIENSVYSKTINKKVSCKRLEVNSDYFVKVPSPESILGDKLTVLSPNYTGISFDSDKQLELIKQFYDVSNLFDASSDINDVIDSFDKICNRELHYRKINDKTYKDVANDIKELCLEIILQNNQDHLNFLSIGIRKFINFMLIRNFNRDEELLTAACKIFYLMNCIIDGREICKFNSNVEVVDRFDYDNLSIETRRRFKTIKKLNKEQFYYLEKAYLG